MFDLIDSIRARDPAKPTTLEVIFAYNGFHAVLIHRFCHVVWDMKLFALARAIANLGRILTGSMENMMAEIEELKKKINS